MCRNIGRLDRIVRIVVGLGLIAFATPVGFPNVGWNWIGWIGIIPLVTGIVGYCPAYSVLRIDTCKA